MTPTSPVAPPPGPQPHRKLFLGQATPRGYGFRPRLTPEAAAAFATVVDTARARAAIEGRTLVYTVRWN
ncbi:MAG TPA: hypothetical protein VMH90_06115 [Thermoplasmata archaeon]|nr:hypothetical protein [Thermoplasmata archaeon]